MPNKPRSDSVLDSLNPEMKAQLVEWLVQDNLSYKDAKARLAEDFNIKTSVGALSRFYALHCFAFRSSEAKEFAEKVVADLQEGAPQFDQATLALVKQKAFERAYARNGNLKELLALSKIIGDSAKLTLKKRDQELAERRIVILEAKAALADKATGIASDGQLSDEEKGARLRGLFGMGG